MSSKQNKSKNTKKPSAAAKMAQERLAKLALEEKEEQNRLEAEKERILLEEKKLNEAQLAKELKLKENKEKREQKKARQKEAGIPTNKAEALKMAKDKEQQKLFKLKIFEDTKIKIKNFITALERREKNGEIIDQKDFDKFDKLKIFFDEIKQSLFDDYGIEKNEESDEESDEESEEEFESDVAEGNEVDESGLMAVKVCILGHADTGKTTFLDKVRGSNVQSKEAAGITQQIGASFRSRESFTSDVNVKIPGFLFVDTPGHQEFKNLRKRGIEICDIAVIIVDIGHGVENQTKESIELCKETGTPFIVALNKIDKIYGWSDDYNLPIMEKIRQTNVFDEFTRRFDQFQLDFSELELNPILSDEINVDELESDDDIIVCPISGVTGEGIDNLLHTIAFYCQENMESMIEFDDNFEGIVMESHKEKQGGFSMDIIVTNGTLNIGDIIGISTLSGGIKTVVKTLLLPENNVDTRMTSSFHSVSFVNGSCGVKILALDIKGVIPGSPIYKLEDEDEDFEVYENIIDLDSEGVIVYAPSFGQVEALVHFLRSTRKSKRKDEPNKEKVFVSKFMIGNVFKKDIMDILRYKPENKVILCFDVDIDSRSRSFIQSEKIKIIKNDTIYRIYEDYMKWINPISEASKLAIEELAIFPCKFTPVQGEIFNRSNPLIIGVIVNAGILKPGCPIITGSGVYVGKITSIQKNRVNVNSAKKDESVAVNIDTKISFGTDRTIDFHDVFYSKLSRESLDYMKQHFKPEIIANGKLCMEIKKLQNII